MNKIYNGQSEIEAMRDKVDKLNRKVGDLDYENAEDLEEDLKYLQDHKVNEASFVVALVTTSDKKKIFKFYKLIEKYYLTSIDNRILEIIDECKWEYKKLSVFDGLGD